MTDLADDDASIIKMMSSREYREDPIEVSLRYEATAETYIKTFDMAWEKTSMQGWFGETASALIDESARTAYLFWWEGSKPDTTDWTIAPENMTFDELARLGAHKGETDCDGLQVFLRQHGFRDWNYHFLHAPGVDPQNLPADNVGWEDIVFVEERESAYVFVDGSGIPPTFCARVFSRSESSLVALAEIEIEEDEGDSQRDGIE